jgi:hypothetical protein
MKRKVETRRTGKKSRKCTTSTLQELSLRKSFFFDKKYESHQGKEPPCSLLELYFSQKGYFLLAPLRYMTAYGSSAGSLMLKRDILRGCLRRMGCCTGG